MNDALVDRPAPAEALVRARWPGWRIVLAYTVLAGVAAGSIWLVDRGAMRAPLQGPRTK